MVILSHITENNKNLQFVSTDFEISSGVLLRGKGGAQIIFWASKGPLDDLRTRVCAKRPTEQKMTPVLRNLGGVEKW